MLVADNIVRLNLQLAEQTGMFHKTEVRVQEAIRVENQVLATDKEIPLNPQLVEQAEVLHKIEVLKKAALLGQKKQLLVQREVAVHHVEPLQVKAVVVHQEKQLQEGDVSQYLL